MNFQIRFQKTAHKDLKRFPLDLQNKILNNLKRFLSATPFFPIKSRLKKLAHFKPPLYRLRMGELRIYYRIVESSVVILAVLHKKETENWLKLQRHL